MPNRRRLVSSGTFWYHASQEVIGVKVTYGGHACFLVENRGTSLIIDPFLTGNPVATIKPESVKVSYVLVTHAHEDHLGDAVAIAKRNDATFISTYEVAQLAASQGVRVHGMHIGGKYAFPFGAVRVTLALHGSGVAGGHACGFVVDLFGQKLYHAGDTGLYSDLKLLNGELERDIDVALLPIGGNYTMTLDDAGVAASWVRPRIVIPMHYNTWPLIAADPREFKARVERATAGTEVRILKPGESTEL